MGNAKPAKSITQGFTKVYIKNEYKTGGSEVRLISWLVDGKPTKIRLERRDYFVDQQGERRNAKCKGFTSEDLRWIFENYNNIEQDMMNATNDLQKTEDAVNQDEVPF